MVTMIDCFNMVFHLTPTYPFYQGALDPKRDTLKKHIGQRQASKFYDDIGRSFDPVFP